MNRPSYLLFKKCTKCGEILHVSKFYKKKDCKYGVCSYCKKCNKKRNKEWREESGYEKKRYEENKEYYKVKNSKYYDNNKEYFEEYYNENKEHLGELRKERYQKNKDKELEQSKIYHKNNPHIAFNGYCRRKEREEKQGRGITKEQWREVMMFFNWKCAYSDKCLGNNKDNMRTIDHIVPLDKGGENEIWNLVPMYRNYNTSKHTSNMLEWYTQQDFFSIDRLTKIYEWRIYAYWKWHK